MGDDKMIQPIQQFFIKYWPLILIVIVAVFSFLYARPILLAFLTALLLNPLVMKVEKYWRKSRRFIVFIFFIIFSICILICCYLLYTVILIKINELSIWVPHLIATLNENWIMLQSKISTMTHDLPRPIILSIQSWIGDMLISLQELATNYVEADRMLNLFQHIPSQIFKLFIYFLALYYLMLEYPQIIASFRKWTRLEHSTFIALFYQHFKKGAFDFVKAQLIVSSAIFFVTLCVLLFIIPKYALFMALLVWFVDLLPLLGGMMVLLPWAVFNLLNGDTLTGTILLILAIVVIALRQILETKVTSSHLGLPPLTTLICMYVGFEIFGVIGFFIGPIFAILIVVVKQFRQSWIFINEKQKG